LDEQRLVIGVRSRSREERERSTNAQATSEVDDGPNVRQIPLSQREGADVGGLAGRHGVDQLALE
jgi:hypothetical protein